MIHIDDIYDKLYILFRFSVFQNYWKLECHPCIAGIYRTIQGDSGALLSLLTEHTRVDVSASVVGESIAAKRDVRMEGNGGGKAVFQLI